MTMFITSYPLVVCSLIRKYNETENNAKIKIKIKTVLHNSVQKNNLNTIIIKKNKTEKICNFEKITREKTNSKLASENYNELLQVCVLHLSTYYNPFNLLQFLVTNTGSSNSTTWLRKPKSWNISRPSTTSSSIFDIWFFPILF